MKTDYAYMHVVAIVGDYTMHNIWSVDNEH